MLSDCRQKKIDLLLVKSVSCFAREVVDGLETIRKLNSFQPDFELYYSIYAAVAQGEQESARDNVAVAIRQKVKDGTSSLYSRTCYGYKKTKMAIS